MVDASDSSQGPADNLPRAVPYRLVLDTAESTVVAECPPEDHTSREYQSEAQLEEELIATLQSQAYERLDIHTNDEMVANLRTQLEVLNAVKFSDAEWKRFFIESIASENDGIVEKTRRIQDDFVQPLRRDDGTTKNIRLIDKEHIHNNRLQVLNQYEAPGGTHENRYDVTILVNGLPLVHIELKRRGVPIRQAFDQIERYQRDSFWSGSGLFEYVQIFIISNGTHTKYYSNSTRDNVIKENKGASKKGKKTSNSFEFTSWWADAANRPIKDLIPFAKTFLSKHTILNVLAHYCVFDCEQTLLVMRPYQIVATERILNRILISENDRSRLGTPAAGGYIWHTTGSGKTLTSFKTAQLASRMDGIDKVLFVVDRKDLDYQTMKEYDRFEKDAVNGSRNTKVLERQMADSDAGILVTTIQKLAVFILRNKAHDIYDGHVVIIFDECHRSQFGDMHKAITKSFKNYHLFGFTGTPIFADNAQSGGDPTLRTTEQAFGDRLHTYTIVDAITDGNVLPFRNDYINTVKNRDDLDDEKVRAIDREAALLAPQRVGEVVSYILEHFDQKTKRDARAYEYAHISNIEELATSKDPRSVATRRSTVRANGFNALFATASIEAAKRYYTEFKRQQERRPNRLKVAVIYSFAPNEEAPDGIMPEEGFDTEALDKSSRDFLDAAIADYNEMFHTAYDTSADKFESYYKDLSLRLKNRQVDLCIVVNMFLTGFDATTLNTLFVDRNLKSHGLIQAFSRTNRILNSVKTFGNVVCFRDLEEEVDDAVALFGDREAGGLVLLKPYRDYFERYREVVTRLLCDYPLGVPIVGEERQVEFVKLFGSYLRLRNVLQAFDQFEDDAILNARDEQDYQSHYIDIYQEMRGVQDAERANINEDIVFEMELVKSVDITIDYILALVRRYHDDNCQDKEVILDIDRAVASSVELRDKRDLIEQFVRQISTETDDVDGEWKTYISQKREEELVRIIEAENLKPEETREFVAEAFRDGEVQESGTAITEILPPMSLFTPDDGRYKKRRHVLELLEDYLMRFYGIS